MLPPLSVLDVIPVGSTTTPSKAIHGSVALAKLVDDLGYRRIWYAEHHNMPTIASSAPEVMIAHVAQQTRRIRVGAGGIMVPNHAPLHIIESFKTLEALHPGRIDLGLGRAPGTDPVAALALGRTGDPSEVNDKLAELFAFAGNAFPEGHAFASLRAMPDDVPMPELWMLGSTSAGASIAAARGMPYAFAGHFNMADAREACELYRQQFTRGQRDAPYLILAVAVICGETDEHAKYLAGPYRVGIAKMLTGKPAPFPSFNEAAVHRFAPMEQAALMRFEHGAVIGSPEKVCAGLERLAKLHNAQELMLSTLIPDTEERAASFRRVSKAAT